MGVRLGVAQILDATVVRASHCIPGLKFCAHYDWEQDRTQVVASLYRAVHYRGKFRRGTKHAIGFYVEDGSTLEDVAEKASLAHGAFRSMRLKRRTWFFSDGWLFRMTKFGEIDAQVKVPDTVQAVWE